MKPPSLVSEDVRRLNPAIYGGAMPDPVIRAGKPDAPKNRLRQNQDPLMNKIETEFFQILSASCPGFPRPRPQAKTYRLANGVRYTPDFTASLWPDPDGGPAKETAWEVKGIHGWDDAIVKIKLAPSAWPEVNWFFVWKQDGRWLSQRMLP